MELNDEQRHLYGLLFNMIFNMCKYNQIFNQGFNVFLSGLMGGQPIVDAIIVKRAYQLIGRRRR